MRGVDLFAFKNISFVDNHNILVPLNIVSQQVAQILAGICLFPEVLNIHSVTALELAVT